MGIGDKLAESVKAKVAALVGGPGTSSVTQATTINTDEVFKIGKMLVEVGDNYPTQFLTERDFFPLVFAYLHGRVPRLDPEADVEGGRVDFRIGGMNPAYLELAVAPRAIMDAVRTNLKFPGHQHDKAATQLYPSVNRTELAKLFRLPFSKAKMRYLLLVDFRNQHEQAPLTKLYKEGLAEVLGKDGGAADINPVRVVYVSPKTSFDFGLGRKDKALLAASATSSSSGDAATTSPSVPSSPSIAVSPPPDNGGAGEPT